MVTKLFIYKTNKRQSSAHKSTVPCLLQHVSADLLYLQGVYTPILQTHWSITHYSSDIYILHPSEFCNFIQTSKFA